MIDEVYDDTIRHYHFAKELGTESLQGSLDAIGSKIDTHAGEAGAIPSWSSILWAGLAPM